MPLKHEICSKGTKEKSGRALLWRWRAESSAVAHQHVRTPKPHGGHLLMAVLARTLAYVATRDRIVRNRPCRDGIIYRLIGKGEYVGVPAALGGIAVHLA